MKKNDIILCGIIFVFAAALILIFYLSKTDGDTVIVKENNQITAQYPLSVDRAVNLSHNTFTIKDGKVYMSFSDCKNQICVKTGKISKRGECIVCLPNRVILEIK